MVYASIFAGGAAGSAFASLLYTSLDWSGIVAAGAAMSELALAAFLIPLATLSVA